MKITKKEHAFERFASTYNIKILFFSTLNYNLKNLNVQLKIKKILLELRGFKFVTTLFLIFKKIES